MFKVGQKLKLQVKSARGNDIFNCRVVGIYERFILIKRKNYKECLLISNFTTGDIVILGGEI